MQLSFPTRPQLIYLAFGPITYHHEARFSIISALSHLQAPYQALDIQVYADRVEPYQDLPVAIHLLDDATRHAWNQPHGYHFRSKHVLLRQVLEQHPLAVLIDTDTFFRRSPLELFRRVKPGTLLCNAIGGRYGESQDSALYQVLHRPLQARGLADDQMPMLNSGVMGLAGNDASALDRSIAYMDEYYPLVPQAYTLEEFCLAVAAHGHLQLVGCTDVIHHYWSRKKQFRAKIHAWLLKHGDNPLSTAALADVAQVTDQLPRPPRLSRLLFKLASLTLPASQRQFARELLYGCYAYANEFDRACAPAWWEKAWENQRLRVGEQGSEQLRASLRHPVLRGLLGAKREVIERHLRDQSVM